MLAAVGFTPIATLAASLIELVPLHVGAPISITAAVGVGLWLTVTDRRLRRPVLRGLDGGVMAVLLYDCTRLPFVILGDWPDFIPRIGVWLLNDPTAPWSIGYLWRYVGNGAGMGLAFAMLYSIGPRRPAPGPAGILFGVAVWTGLMTTLAIAPDGQAKMFRITPATVALSLIGHLVYGTMLGLYHRRREYGSTMETLQPGPGSR